MIKSVVYIISILTFGVSCTSKTTNTSSESTAVSAVMYDTIIINYNKQTHLEKIRNTEWEQFNMQTLIDSLQSITKIPGLNTLTEEKLPFGDYRTFSQYYENNIPLSIYQRIFPKEEILIDRRLNTKPTVDEKSKTITIFKGTRIREDRQFKTLLSVTERPNFLQLLLTKQGKYVPEISLINIDKTNLKVIDQINLYGGIYDSYDVDYWNSSFNEDLDQFTKTEIKNIERNEVKLDTSYTHYKILNNGRISKISI